MIEMDVIKKTSVINNHQIEIYMDSVDYLRNEIHIKDSIHKAHITKCAYISKEQLRYTSQGVIYIKTCDYMSYNISNTY